MLTVETPEDLAAHVGTPIGPSPWRAVEEEKVIAFARLCGDDHWIHTDPERAARETEFGGVIAQGFLTLSMTTSMLGEAFDVRRASRWLNYGIERLRFTGPVRGGATRIEIDLSVEAEGAAKPVLVARSILLAFP